VTKCAKCTFDQFVKSGIEVTDFCNYAIKFFGLLVIVFCQVVGDQGS
jgi:hypothetical protein